MTKDNSIDETSERKRSSEESLSDRPTKKGAISDPGDASVDEGATDDPCLQLIEPSTQHPSEEQVARSEELLEKENYADALVESTKVLGALPPLPVIAQAALIRGRALLQQANSIGEKTANGESEDELQQQQQDLYEQAWNAFGLSNRLDPDCEETMNELDNITKILGELRPAEVPPGVAEADVDVLIVGAGAAGVGTAVMLTKTFGLETSRVLLVEKGASAGESFRQWPAEMRFISPSFNQQGWTDSFDLNSIAHGTSPAYSLHSEHPSGAEYAKYLSAIAKTNELNIRTNTMVASVEAIGEDEELPLFSVTVRSAKEDGKDDAKEETLKARYVVWAAGEFQYPRGSSGHGSIVGSEHCLHNSKVRSWAKLPGNDFIIIGGYESGIDATVNLAKAGKQCQLLASTPCWNVKTADPSAELAPYTAGRLRDVMAPDFAHKPKLLAPLCVVKIEPSQDGGFDVHARWLPQDKEPVHAPLRNLSNVVAASTEPPGKEGSRIVLHTPSAPILATGFEGSVNAAANHLFAIADENHPHKGCLADAPLLTEEDESTKTPGVFLVGPSVQHDKLSFCFVYKFRQRFAVVANAICQGLGMDTKAAVAECRSINMYLDDFARCEDTCGEVC